MNAKQLVTDLWAALGEWGVEGIRITEEYRALENRVAAFIDQPDSQPLDPRIKHFRVRLRIHQGENLVADTDPDLAEGMPGAEMKAGVMEALRWACNLLDDFAPARLGATLEEWAGKGNSLRVSLSTGNGGAQRTIPFTTAEGVLHFVTLIIIKGLTAHEMERKAKVEAGPQSFRVNQK